MIGVKPSLFYQVRDVTVMARPKDDVGDECSLYAHGVPVSMTTSRRAPFSYPDAKNSAYFISPVCKLLKKGLV
jgi:hypothetical protein